MLLYEIARETLDRVDGNVERASSILNRRLVTDESLRSKVIADIMREACKTVIGRQHREKRSQIVNQMTGRSSVKAMGAAVASTVFNFPLLDGTKLGDAKRPDLCRAIEHYEKSEYAAGRNKKWLSSICSRLNDDETIVRNVISEDEAEKLFKKAA